MLLFVVSGLKGTILLSILCTCFKKATFSQLPKGNCFRRYDMFFCLGRGSIISELTLLSRPDSRHVCDIMIVVCGRALPLRLPYSRILFSLRWGMVKILVFGIVYGVVPTPLKWLS